jgi:hypothetical protein
MSNIAHVRPSQNWHYLVMKIRELNDQLLFVPRSTAMLTASQYELSTEGANNHHRNRTLDAAELLEPQAILKEVDALNKVSIALHGLTEEHVAISDGLLRVAESVRNMATMLAVLAVVTTR